MSLFDCISSDEESVVSDSVSDDIEKVSYDKDFDNCKISSNMESSDDVRRLIGLPSRNTLLSSDITVTKVGHGAFANTLHDSSLSSGFGEKIAKSLQSREKQREEIRLKRIQEQRRMEAKDASLVKKDKDVGIFITPAYKELLQRNSKISESTFNAAESIGRKLQNDVNNNNNNNIDGGDDDDDEEPLGKFIRTLQNQQNAKAISANIDQNSSAQTQNEKQVDNTQCSIANTQELSNEKQDTEQCKSVDQVHYKLGSDSELSHENTTIHQLNNKANVITVEELLPSLLYHKVSDEYLATCTANSNERIASHVHVHY